MTETSLYKILSDLPYRTDSTLALGGSIKNFPEDFIVTERPLYDLSGEGEHLFLFVEKKCLSTPRLIRVIAQQFDLNEEVIGIAGMKDTFAVTRQWLSLPYHLLNMTEATKLIGEVFPTESISRRGEKLSNGEGEKFNGYWKILDVGRHNNKLRTGHLAGNDFSITIRNFIEPVEKARGLVENLVEVLQRRGIPNYFGAQRFGQGGHTLEIGLELLRGNEFAAGKGRRAKRLKKLAFNAVQSAIFNEVLKRRLTSTDTDIATVLIGDRVEWHDHTRFVLVEDCDLQQEAQRAVDLGEASVTGPMAGPRHPQTIGIPREIELEVYDLFGISDDSFTVAKKLARGTRRPFTIPLRGCDVVPNPLDDSLTLHFGLPPGTYATVVLRELLKTGGVYEE